MSGTKKTWQVLATNFPATPHTAIPNLILLQQHNITIKNIAANPKAIYPNIL